MLTHPRAWLLFAAPALAACWPVENGQSGSGQAAAQAGSSGVSGAGGIHGQGGAGSNTGQGGAGGSPSGSGAGGSGGGPNPPFALGAPKTSNVFAFVDIELGDLDGDGCADLVLAGTGAPPRVNVYPGACDGSFPGPAIVHPLTTFDDMALGDVDGDGKVDVFTQASGSPPRVEVRKTGAAFMLGPPVTTGVWTYDRLWVGDVNGDGRAEALTTHLGASPPTVFVWSGPGDGSLSQLSSVAPPLFDAGAFHGDFLIGSSGFQPSVRWLSGQANGSLSIGAPQNVFTFSALSLGDLDGDGDADLLTDVPGNNWVISLYPNVGGSFGPAMTFQGFSYWALRSADLDGDGKSDVIVAPTGAPPRVTAWLSQ